MRLKSKVALAGSPPGVGTMGSRSDGADRRATPWPVLRTPTHRQDGGLTSIQSIETQGKIVTKALGTLRRLLKTQGSFA